jgi:glycosyltransferase involved in cell wall biosynthesis
VADNSYPQPGGKDSGPRPHLVSYVLTLNEEANICEAIRSVHAISDAVVVVDSGSDDRTVEVAVAAGARVWHRQFDSEHLQRNWALERIDAEWPGSWVLEIDADERLTAGLADEIQDVLATGPDLDAYLVTLRFVFDHRLIRFGGFSRTRVPRFRRANAGRYEEREINPHLSLSSRRLGRLTGHIIHTDVVSWERHIDKHNRYSSLEAKARFRTVAYPKLRVRTLTAIRSPYLRRRWVREHIWNRLPAHSLLLFLSSYLFLGGFLDGRAGLRSAVFRSWQVMCTDLKFRNLRGDFRSIGTTAAVRQPLPRGGGTELVACILTLNEESHIVEAILSARSVTNQVIVVDSYSTDSTQDLASRAGAQVWTHCFRNWGAQRNWALNRIENEFHDPWVLFLDADERLSSKLAQEILEKQNKGDTRFDAYLIEHTLIFAGRALRFGGFTGTKWARLLRASAGRHEERAVNDHLILRSGSRVSRMRGRIIHQDVRDWERYVAKQNRYSTLEAKELFNRDIGGRSVTLRQAIANPPWRRRWLRETIWPSIPLKPVVRFLQIYLMLGSALDGYPGLCLATMQAWQEMCVEMKYDKMKSQTQTIKL